MHPFATVGACLRLPARAAAQIGACRLERESGSADFTGNGAFLRTGGFVDRAESGAMLDNGPSFRNIRRGSRGSEGLARRIVRAGRAAGTGLRGVPVEVCCGGRRF